MREDIFTGPLSKVSKGANVRLNNFYVRVMDCVCDSDMRFELEVLSCLGVCLVGRLLLISACLI